MNQSYITQESPKDRSKYLNLSKANDISKGTVLRFTIILDSIRSHTQKKNGHKISEYSDTKSPNDSTLIDLSRINQTEIHNPEQLNLSYSVIKDGLIDISFQDIMAHSDMQYPNQTQEYNPKYVNRLNDSKSQMTQR